MGWRSKKPWMACRAAVRESQLILLAFLPVSQQKMKNKTKHTTSLTALADQNKDSSDRTEKWSWTIFFCANINTNSWRQSWPIPKIGLNTKTNSFGRPLINTNININSLEGLLSISIPIPILPKKSISIVLSIPISNFVKGIRLCVTMVSYWQFSW